MKSSGWLIWLGLCIALPLYGQTLRKVDDVSFAALSKQRGPYLDVRAPSAEELNDLMQLYTGRFSSDFKPAAYSITLKNAKRAFIPMDQLSPNYQSLFVTKMWPKNNVKGDFYYHTVTHKGVETLWSIAAWFTGDGQNYRKLKKINGLRRDGIGAGQLIKIPLDQLTLALAPQQAQVDRPRDPVVASTTPVEEVSGAIREDEAPVTTKPNENATLGLEPKPSDPEPPKKDDPPQVPSRPTSIADLPPKVRSQMKDTLELRKTLSYAADSKGKYAIYRLDEGEAIYSSVVVRFCGLIRADAVNQLADEIIRRSNIRDETDIPVGTAIKIPYEHLEPDFLEDSDPRFLAYLAELAAVSEYAADFRSRNLEGIHIILDAGHGGRDPGAKFGRVWEDDFVYDIVCRIKARLEKETAASVLTTVYDPSVGHKVQNVSRFNLDDDEYLTTKPLFKLNSSRSDTDGVNLRWMLANNRLVKLKKSGVDPQNVVFASFHADSLHPSLRGSMVYIPDTSIYPKSPPRVSSRLAKYAETYGNNFSFSLKDVRQAQAYSRNLALNFLQEAAALGVPTHRNKPIRTIIHRSRHSTYVPAVIRNTRAPTRLLIEVCNIHNSKDRAALRDHRFRQKVADAFVQALYRNFNVRTAAATFSGSGVKTAAKAR